jgi:hypothetical protein
VLFQLAPPDEVFASFSRKTVSGKRRKDGVVCGKRACSYMKHSEPWVGRYCGLCDAEGHVIDWNHVDSIVDIRNKSELDASLREAPDKIVGVSNYGLSSANTNGERT